MTEPALFDVGQAAHYLGVSRTYFDDHLRKFIPVIDMKGPDQKQAMWRFAKADLDAFIESRRKAKKSA